MQFLFPAAAIGFAGLGFITLLYILKHNYVDTPVSSTRLWREVLVSATASTPFKRLRNSLLLILQLLMAALLTLCLMQPAANGDDGGEVLYIFDISGSMAAEDNGETRLQRAVESARALTDSFGANTLVSVVTSGAQTNQLISRSTDRQALADVFNLLKSDNSNANLNDALLLAGALKRQSPELRTYVYTDQATLPAEVQDAVIAQAYRSVENACVLSLTTGASGEVAQALVKIANYGQAKELTIELYSDGILTDARRVECDENGISELIFDIPENARRLTARIVEPDSLPLDNAYELVIPEKITITARVVGDTSVFWDSALSLHNDIQLTHMSASDASQLTNEQSDSQTIYLLLGDSAGELASKPPIATSPTIIVAPKQAVADIVPGEIVNTPAVVRLATPPSDGKMFEIYTKIVENLSVENVAVREYTPLTGGIPILTANGSAIASVDIADGRYALVFGFELTSSNIALKPDFPILVQNALNAFFAQSGISGMNFDTANCGDTLMFTPATNAVSVEITTPDSRKITPDISVRPSSFADTTVPGIYVLSQTTTDESNLLDEFAVNMSRAESNLLASNVQSTNISDENSSDMSPANVVSGVTAHVGASNSLIIMLMAFGILVLLIVEWWVSRSVI